MSNMKHIKDHSLYLVTGEEYSGGRSTLEVAKEAVASGVDILQMREKTKSEDELRSLGKELSSLCSKSNTAFIVNDDPYLAKEVGADGVHLGQEDMRGMPIAKAREILGTGGIIGVSTHSLEQFAEANRMDVDYIAYGPIFPTKTKDYHIGIEDITKVMSVAEKPVIFIGGIDLDNINGVLYKGARNIAMIRAITAAEDVGKTVKTIKNRMNCR